VERVAIGIDGVWAEAMLDPPQGRYVWQSWHFQWQATVGEHVLECRATDRNGETQPFEPPWDTVGFGQNAVQRVGVTVR
jgi:hypothetical protein